LEPLNVKTLSGSTYVIWQFVVFLVLFVKLPWRWSQKWSKYVGN